MVPSPVSKFVSFGSPLARGESSIRTLFRYHPHCARYVRSLTLQHTNLVVPQHEYISSDYEIGLSLQTAKGWEWTKKLAETKLSLWLFCDTREGRDHKALNSDFAKFFASLTHLTSLTIKWHPFPSYASTALDASNPLLSAGWKALSRTLTTLTIQIQLDYLPRLLTTSLNFDWLENFTIIPEPVKRDKKRKPCTPRVTTTTNDHDDILQTTLVPFVNRHSATIRSLYIGWKDFDFPIAIFSSFEKLPHLRQFTVSGGSVLGIKPGAGKPGLERFLELNSTSLTDIHWQFPQRQPPLPPPSAAAETGPSLLEHWFNEASYNIPLPNLQKLTLTNPSHTLLLPSISTLTPYIAQHSKSLTSLTLLDTKLDQNSLSTLARHGTINGLTEFEFTTYIFTFMMLTLATSVCPRLETLKLSYTHLGRHLTSGPSQFVEYGRDKFAQDLAAVGSGGIRWGSMKTLVLNGGPGGSAAAGTRYYDDQDGFRLEQKMFLGALQSVETINGEKREAILAS